MSTVKISELPLISQINANTANTLFAGVDIPTSATFRMTAKTLAQGLYSNEILNVGTNQQNLPNTVAQFALSGQSYIQTNLVNTNDGGSADIVVTANTGSGGTDSANFIDMGYANKYYQPGLEFNNIGNAIYPLDGYLYVQGTASSNGGNLVIGTTTSGTNLRFIVGGGTAKNVVAKMTSTGLTMNTGTSITFADGSVQTVASNPAAYSTAAYTQANVTIGVDASQNARMTIIEGVDASQNNSISYINGVNLSQNNQVTIIQGVDTTQNTAIAATDGKMQSAYNTANNALANTSGTFAGNLTITGSVTANTGNIGAIVISNNTIYSSLTNVDMVIGQALATANLVINRTTNIIKDLNITANLTTGGALIDFNNSTFNSNIAFVQITGSNNAVTVAPSNTNYMLQVTGKANSVTRVVIDSFGQNTYPVVVGRMGRGSADLPTAIANGDVMMRIVGNGYTGTQFPSSSPTKIDFVADENFSDTNRGTQIQFWNTATGSNTIQKVATFNANSATFIGTVNPTKGFIYTPFVYPNAQTAITIDFANNSMVRAQTSTGLVVSMSNYTVGKMVELWITNLAGTNQTYTTGVPAINSTLNATTYTIPGTSTVCARYFCVDGTLANTLVSVVHA